MNRQFLSYSTRGKSDGTEAIVGFDSLNIDSPSAEGISSTSQTPGTQIHQEMFVGYQQPMQSLDANVQMEQTTSNNNPMDFEALNRNFQIYLRQTQERTMQDLTQQANSSQLSDFETNVQKQRKKLSRILIRMSDKLEKVAKQISESKENWNERTRQITVRELERDLFEMWMIISNSGLLCGLVLLILGIPGLIVLLASLIAMAFGATTSRPQAEFIVRVILPLIRKINGLLTGMTISSVKIGARSLKLLATGKKGNKKKNQAQFFGTVDTLPIE